MQRAPVRHQRLRICVALVLCGLVFVWASAMYLSRHYTERCLVATPSPNTDETQIEITGVPRYFRGTLTCTWANLERSRVASRTLPLYRR